MARGATATPVAHDPAGSTELPATLEELRKIPYSERHAALKVATGDVAVDLHVGLDLIQAGDSETPCRTFADALSTIESSPNSEAYVWALNEAVVPADGQDAVCSQLSERLAAALDAATPSKDSEPEESSRRSSRQKPRSKPQRPTSNKSDASAQLPTRPQDTNPEKTAPPEPPKRTASVTKKLDDDLRGLGE